MGWRPLWRLLRKFYFQVHFCWQNSVSHRHQIGTPASYWLSTGGCPPLSKVTHSPCYLPAREGTWELYCALSLTPARKSLFLSWAQVIRADPCESLLHLKINCATTWPAVGDSSIHSQYGGIRGSKTRWENWRSSQNQPATVGVLPHACVGSVNLAKGFFSSESSCFTHPCGWNQRMGDQSTSKNYEFQMKYRRHCIL